MSASAWELVGRSQMGFEHIYFYHSTDPLVAPLTTAPAVLYLHRNEHSMKVEYVSRGAGLTDMHGSWSLSPCEQKLSICFNCREGTSARGSDQPPRTQMHLHPTILHRANDPADLDARAPENASWEGLDDKGCVIHLVHFKSFVKFGKPVTYRKTDPL